MEAMFSKPLLMGQAKKILEDYLTKEVVII